MFCDHDWVILHSKLLRLSPVSFPPVPVLRKVKASCSRSSPLPLSCFPLPAPASSLVSSAHITTDQARHRRLPVSWPGQAAMNRTAGHPVCSGMWSTCRQVSGWSRLVTGHMPACDCVIRAACGHRRLIFGNLRWRTQVCTANTMEYCRLPLFLLNSSVNKKKR